MNPKFLKISSENKHQIGLKKTEIARLKKRKLLTENNFKLTKLQNLNSEFQQISLKIKNLCFNSEDHSYFIHYIKTLAEKSELKSDIIRNRKLEKLSNDKKFDYNKIKVQNRT